MTEIRLIILGCIVAAMLLHGLWWRKMQKEFNGSLHATIKILTQKIQRLEKERRA